MKRIMMSVLAALLVLSAGAPTVSAAGHGHNQSRTQSCVTSNTQTVYCTGCGNICKHDSNGICSSCTDEDGDGICDLQGTCQNTTGNRNCGVTGKRAGHHGARH